MASSLLVPTVLESTGRGERAYDIYSRLLRERIIMVNGQIEETMANLIVAQLLFLASESQEREVNLYISSPGGVIAAGLAIYDTMRYLSCPIATTCIGYAASFGTILLLAGDKGRRRALPNARIHLHQPLIHGGI
ncbi:MAG TPA: ATP-dependent Clp protease proteolytic subunit, partial [Ktedonobacteraceae bacterium]|nr:ATP-dependent Clp protease proteolytic subunit [Ktedonobacteraceae bacterium]